MSNYVYILYSKKLDRFYTGFTQNFDLRMEFHRNPESRKFTAKANDWEVFMKIECSSKEQGLKVESHIKRMKSKKYIYNLKSYPEMQIKLLNKYTI